MEAQLAQQTSAEQQAQALSLPKKLLSAAKGTKSSTRGCLHSCCSLPRSLRGRQRRYSRRPLDDDPASTRGARQGPTNSASTGAHGRDKAKGGRSSTGTGPTRHELQKTELELDDIEAGSAKSSSKSGQLGPAASSLRQRPQASASASVGGTISTMSPQDPDREQQQQQQQQKQQQQQQQQQAGPSNSKGSFERAT